MTSEKSYRRGLAVGGGLLLAAAFPKIGIAGFAWIAPGVILASGMGAPGRQAWWLGYLAGLTHYLGSLYWLLNIPVIKILPFTAWVALSAFLALYPACWVWLCWRAFPIRLKGDEARLEQILENYLGVGWGQRMLWAGSCAALWVTWEMIQARFLSGFPWNFLGTSQYRMVPLLQVSSVTGVYGLSFLAAWFAVTTLGAGTLILRRSYQTRRWMGELVMPLFVTLGLAFVGVRQIARPLPNSSSGSIKLALIQPSIPQQWIWLPTENSKRFDQLLQLSEQALVEKPDLLVWPEAATPGLVRWDTNILQAITNLTQRHQVWLILGGDDVVPRRDPDDPNAVDVFNSSFLVSPQGEFKGTYRKRRLVIFGEYIPMHRWLPFLERWTGMGSFTPGTQPVAFVIPELGVKTSVLICFEDVFPHWTRDYVDEDTDFLLNLTNNGWFGEGAAQWQHAATAVFRAVENRLPLVRCSNNGLTCWVDAHGRMRDLLFRGSKDIYRAGFKIVQIPLPKDKRRPPTFYSKFGDVFGWSCVGWSVLWIGGTLLRKRRES